MENFHVIAILVYETHTKEALFNLISTLLHSLIGFSWKHKLIDIYNVKDYLDTKHSPSNSHSAMWIYLHVFNEILVVISVSFKSVQGKDTLILEQNSRFQMLIDEIRALARIEQNENGTSLDLFIQASQIPLEVNEIDRKGAF